jgi:putative transposase
VRYTLRQAEGGTAVEDVCRSLGISQATFYIWKKKYGDLGPSEVPCLRQLEDENARLKRRELAVWVRQTYGLAIDKACDLAKLSRSCWYKLRKNDQQEGLRIRIREITNYRPRFGCERIHVMLKREGWQINLKRDHRLYYLEGLQVRMRRRRKKHMSLYRGMPPPANAPNEPWSMVPQGFPLVILSMISWLMVWLFGCSRWSITGVARVCYWRLVLSCQIKILF